MKRVVAGIATEQVVPRSAVQPVLSLVSQDDVVRCVARAVEVGDARQGQVLDVGAQREADGAEDDVVKTFAGILRHLVQHAVDDIPVIAFAAGHAVIAGPAIKGVVAVAAEQGIAAAIALELIAGGIVSLR